MNSEELEVSLRSEFETYLNNVLAEKQQEVSQLQEQVKAELDRHKTQLDEVLSAAIGNFATEHHFSQSFREGVVEHLRLARDEGAQITAMAIAQAEDLEKESASATVTTNTGIKEIYDAVNDISSKPSQSEILKSLVHHANQFAPRGAFFIVKNEHLVGWRVFGKEKGTAEEKVREVFVPVTADSVLSESVKTLSSVTNSTGGFHADAEVLRKLEFGEPLKMVAIPLTARGRGVAVLYADYGNQGGDVNVEALEILVRVAGLTVEVLASSKSAPSAVKKPAAVNEVVTGETGGLSSEVLSSYQHVPAPATVVAPEATYETFAPAPVVETVKPVEPVESVATTYNAPVAEPEEYVAPAATETAPAVDYQDYQIPAPTAPLESFSPETEPSKFDTWSPAVEQPSTPEYGTPTSYEVEEEKYPTFETTSSWSQTTNSPAPGFSAQEFAQNFAKETDPAEYAKDFSYSAEETQSFQAPEQPIVPPPAPVEEFVPTKNQTFEIEGRTTAPKSRLSERNVDLPIEVGEDERRLHNDARRFARLLVSEIKLYNEQKVKEGRDASDLYDRLKEAIDRSREMYDKRVQPPVAAKFDYFHYEVVNTLAEGDDNKMGSDYPGTAV